MDAGGPRDVDADARGGRGPGLAGAGVADGTAEPITQAIAAAMALFPLVAVAVFALARLLGFGR